ncbi:hypothetical protein J2Z69_002679 [Paenibacillus shirakamiensis]|uniref:Tryptophan-rich sensory protein n=1 Tax=Paenibacillus shirakamiensis TaxID=1265935 RepID=A0ABS4JIV6_9BACL|nr:tryptophan-rich sensory protein [Paenibacillus shirakamiensis]MBP2001634.1 hypothetical protein [Paenibacillus shirakamiensis]
MFKSNVYRWWNLLLFIGVIVVNTLAVTIPLGGRSTGEISDMYHTSITPAGYAFSIWGVIYLLLAGFVIYQLLHSQVNRESVQTIGIWFSVSCLFNILWIILWQYLYTELSLLAMAGLLVSLIMIYRRIRAIRGSFTWGEILLVRLPFSIYLSWICVATLVNVAVVLSKNGFSGWGLSNPQWAIIMLTVGAFLAIWVSYSSKDGIFPLVFVWAYIAIAAEQHETKNVYLVAGALAIILFIYAIWLLIQRARSRD